MCQPPVEKRGLILYHDSPSNLLTGIRKYADCFQNFSLVETVGRLLARAHCVACFRSLELYFQPLDFGTDKTGLSHPEWTVRELSTNDVENDSFEPGLPGLEEIKKWFSQGSRLFALLQDRKIIGVNWVNPKFADLGFIFRPQLSFCEGVIYLHSAIVAPSYRNRGAGSFLKQKLIRTLKQEGFQTVFIATFLKDPAVHRWHKKNGFQKWGRIRYIQWLGKEFWLIHRTKKGGLSPNLIHA